jgi:hypothetical protein
MESGRLLELCKGDWLGRGANCSADGQLSLCKFDAVVRIALARGTDGLHLAVEASGCYLFTQTDLVSPEGFRAACGDSDRRTRASLGELDAALRTDGLFEEPADLLLAAPLTVKVAAAVALPGRGMPEASDGLSAPDAVASDHLPIIAKECISINVGKAVLAAGAEKVRKGFNCKSEALSSTLEEDSELSRINARKMAELKRRIEIATAPKPPKPVEKSNKELVMEKLYDRGDEVLNTAYSYYPKETPIVVDHLATYLKQNPKTEKISGGELLSIFRTIGLRFSLKTSIKVQEKGKFVDLADKFKIKREDEA